MKKINKFIAVVTQPQKPYLNKLIIFLINDVDFFLVYQA